MAILNYTTKIDSDKTIMEIQKILVLHGATKITTDYNTEGVPIAVTFCLYMDGVLPANYSGVLASMKSNKKVTRALCTDEQALRVSWRILKDWVAAQCALVEARLAEMAEVFLPYALTKNGNTLYREIKETPDQLQLKSGN